MFGQRPEIFLIGGSNGAGKTTVADVLLPTSLRVTQFVNADFIAKGLSPHDPDASAFAAGRILLNRIRELRSKRETFSFESTLASRTLAAFLTDAQAEGYAVHVIFVSLVAPDLAVRRVHERTSKGGHDIPEATIRRRYVRAHRNFFRLYMPLADEWSLWDNTERIPRRIAQGFKGKKSTIHDPLIWEQTNAIAGTDGP